jgi:hypothetical protein
MAASNFDTCQIPFNVMDAHFRSFWHDVLPKRVEQGIAVLGMKPMGDGNVPKSGRVNVRRVGRMSYVITAQPDRRSGGRHPDCPQC